MMAEPLNIPSQYSMYGQSHPLKPYQPYVSRKQPQNKTAATELLQLREKRSPAATGPRQAIESINSVTLRPYNNRLSSCKRPRKPAKVNTSDSNSQSVVGDAGSIKSSGSGSAVLSSTPHAPRKKKSVLDLIPLGESNLLPTTHDLIKKHNYVDSGRLKVVKKETSVRDDGRVVSGEIGKKNEVANVARRHAWEDDDTQKINKEKKLIKVQPFRRTTSSAPPHGVPLLNLTKLNEPDDQMKPVELLVIDDKDGSDSMRSGMSCGVPFSKSPDYPIEEDDDKTIIDDDVISERGMKEEVIEEIEEEISETRQIHMDMTHKKFVEDKILSHERAISTLPATPTRPHTHDHAHHKVGVVMQSHATFGMGMCENDLGRRIRFEARVLTHNGRDMHRDLCGFFFLADNSITVYEFRRFGKKSSALPLVQRKIYYHQLGHRKGELYQINYIKKGSTLHFPTSLLPSLPNYMTSQPLLSLRITQCSEREKRHLLCANRNSMECVSIDEYLHYHLTQPEQTACSELKTLQDSIRGQLLGRACKTLVGLGRHLTSHTPFSSSSVTRQQLRVALNTFHIFINDKDYNRLWYLLSTMSEYCAMCEGEREGEGVRIDRCIAGVIGEMNEDRKAIVRKVFQKLDTAKDGLVTLTNIQRFYRYPTNELEGVWFDHTHKTSQHVAMTTINYADFENYYEGMSICIASDSEFITTLQTSWTL